MMCYTIEEIKDKTIPIAKKHGISRMCLFLMQEEKQMMTVMQIFMWIKER